MNKVCVVYWSGTGHTEAMAQAVAESSQGKLFTAAEFGPDQAKEYDAIAMGCPAMSAEVLEEEECLGAGTTLACDSVICQDDPDEDALAACRALGETLK